jgi:hypothetical protein
MTVQYFTRCNNDTLHGLSQQLCPIPILKVENFNDYHGAAGYLYHILNEAEEWAVNIDIDCFLTHPPSVDRILEEMKKNNFTHCGIPDGGVIPLRSFSWCTTQPFFNIFNAKKIREIKNDLGLSWDQIADYRYDASWNSRIPDMVRGNWDANRYEPFNGLFFFLFKYGRALFLDGMTMADGISTAVIWANKTIAYHSWFAREFDISDSCQIRIRTLHNKAVIDALINREFDMIPSFRDPVLPAK